jgi:hypothetical protein
MFRRRNYAELQYRVLINDNAHYMDESERAAHGVLRQCAVCPVSRCKKTDSSLAAADSDDLARVYRFDLAQDSEMISPTIPI